MRVESDAVTRVSSGATLEVGAVFANRYVIERALGEGGMGSVYAVLDRELDERVALKVLMKALEAADDRLERFRREVRVARRVTHRNAARIFDIGEHAGLYYLTMELIEGEDLETRLEREGPLPMDALAEIACQICDGLGGVHEAGVVHRDLKPGNVMLATDGRVMLTDFGVARSTLSDDRLTLEPGMIVGTPHYMSPEQVSGGAISPRTDIYALGLLLYEMATGTLPFLRDTPVATAVARLHERPEPLHAHAKLPQLLVSAIMSCLRRDPEQRPADAATVREWLEGLRPTQARPGKTDTTGAGARTVTEQLSPISSTFAGLDPGGMGLAVLPFHYRGPADDAHLSEVLTEQLIDLLSMTRGLRVPAFGATAAFTEHRDPRTVGRQLGVDAIVDGTLHRSGSRIRVVLRLLDSDTGYQTWSERLDGELEDVFDIQDHIATKVAETLRLQLESSRYGHTGSPEAMALYMRARSMGRRYRYGGRGPDGAAALLQRCLELAPDFGPALALYGKVCARMWFLFGDRDGGDTWQGRGQDAIDRALRIAPGLPDTHLAVARMASQRADFARAARALQHVLELAPTHAEAHSFLGTLQCEAGRPEEGLRRIDLAVELDPSQMWPLVTTARHHALRGDRERMEELARRIWDEDVDSRYPLVALQVRLAIWQGDLLELRRMTELLTAWDRPVRPMAETVARYVLGERNEEQLRRGLAQSLPPHASPRYRALLEQMVVEGLLARGATEQALAMLGPLAESSLVDVDWLERCPLMQPLRDESRMVDIRGRVRDRAMAIWEVG